MAEPGAGAGGWLNQKWKGVPHWAIVGGVGALVVGIYVLKKRASANSSSSGTATGATLPSNLSGYGYPAGAGDTGAGGAFGGGTPYQPPTTITGSGLPTGGTSSGSTPAVPAPSITPVPNVVGPAPLSESLPVLGQSFPGVGTIVDVGSTGTAPVFQVSPTPGAVQAPGFGPLGPSQAQAAGLTYSVIAGDQGTGPVVPPAQRIPGERYDSSGRVIA